MLDWISENFGGLFEDMTTNEIMVFIGMYAFLLATIWIFWVVDSPLRTFKNKIMMSIVLLPITFLMVRFMPGFNIGRRH